MIKLVKSLLAGPEQAPPDVPPTPESLAQIARQYHRLRPLCAVGLWKMGRFTSSGVENIPREGPVVILTNHVAELDALHINFAARRPVIFLAAASVFNGDLRARFLMSMGMVPKRKFTPDARAIRTLRQWVDSGAAVGVFPEGERSWDGQPLGLVPGIGKLVRFLGAPVVTGRVHNGDHFWPRWAERPRRGRIHVEFDAPVTFDRRAPEDEIQAHIADRIRVCSASSQRWPVRGQALAEGMSKLVFLCPACDALETLREERDRVSCSACGAQWRVDTANRLHALRAPAQDTSVADLVARLRATLAVGWVQSPPRFAADGVVLESGPGRLLDQSGARTAELGQGRLQLTRTELRFLAGESSLTVPLSALRAVSIEERRRLWLITADRILEPDLPHDSIVKWGWAIQHWRDAASVGAGP